MGSGGQKKGVPPKNTPAALCWLEGQPESPGSGHRSGDGG